MGEVHAWGVIVWFTLDEVLGALVGLHPIFHDPDVHGLIDGPSDVLCLSAYNGESVHTDRMSHGMAVLIFEHRP